MSDDAKFTLKTKNARNLLRTVKHGILSTQSLDLPGYPFGSITPYALDKTGRPIILISDLAQHTKNIKEDPKVSITIVQPSTDDVEDVQVNGRLTYIGDARLLNDDEIDAKERYFRLYPQTRSYFEVHDFNFYVIELKRARYIKGFGKIWWVEKDEMELESVFTEEAESGIITHMNEDHKAALVKYCKKDYNFSNAEEEYSMVGIDNEGLDLKVGLKHVRINFDEVITEASQVRTVLVDLAKEAETVDA